MFYNNYYILIGHGGFIIECFCKCGGCRFNSYSEFEFSFPHSVTKTNHGVDLCHSTHNVSEIGQCVENRVS